MYENDRIDEIGVALSRSNCGLEVIDREARIKKRSPIVFDKRAYGALTIYPAIGTGGFYLVEESDELWRQCPEGGTITCDQELLSLNGGPGPRAIRLFQLTAYARALGYSPATDLARKLPEAIGKGALAAGVAYTQEALRTCTTMGHPARDVLRLAALAVNLVSYSDSALSSGETAAMRVGCSKILAQLKRIKTSGDGDTPREADLLRRSASYLSSCLSRHKRTADWHGSMLNGIGGDDYKSLVTAVTRIENLMDDRGRIQAGPKFEVAR